MLILFASVSAAGKAAAAEVVASPAARDLTADEADTLEADVAATRQRLLNSCACAVRVEAVLVLDGPLQ